MIAMDFGDRAGFDVIGEQFSAAADGELDVRQAPLVAAFAGVADDDRQRVEAEVVVIGPGNGAADEISAIAAADVEDDRVLRPNSSDQRMRPSG